MDTNKPNSRIDLNRIEDKYLIDKDHLVEAKHVIETYLTPYYPDPKSQFVMNTSIYFDSPDLTFIKQHLQGLDNRRKVRIRSYAPNGGHNTVFFIEVKSKTNGKTIKTRLQVSEEAAEHIMQHCQIPIDNQLIDENMEMPHEEIMKNAKYINYVMMSNKVKPVCKITYKRCAYQDDETFRVTLDENIRVTPIMFPKLNVIQDIKNQELWDELKEYGEKFYNQDNFIVEVKHKDNVPDWMNELLKKVDAKEGGFSKYVWSMFQIMSNTLKLLK